MSRKPLRERFVGLLRGLRPDGRRHELQAIQQGNDIAERALPADGSDSSICHICDGLQPEIRDHFGNYKGYEWPLDVLQKQAGIGCSSCALLYDGLHLYSDRWTQYDISTLRLAWRSPAAGLIFRVYVHYYWHESAFRVICELEFHVKPGHTSTWDALIQLTDETTILERPDLSLGFDRARSWLDHCVQSHSLCNKSLLPLPKRVVDVGLVLGGKQLRLYESQQEDSLYTALSHCWGSSTGARPPLRTLKGNIEARKRSIDWIELSKTFQDAILVNQQLGIRYIWIDSLCIIQDDEEDWQEQSGQMKRIYAGSYLTIAATGASNGADGCFSTRVPHQELYNGVLIREVIDHTHYTGIGTLTTVSNPLFGRAWCLQERFLAMRVLHYAAEEMVWECQTSTLCECGDVSEFNSAAKRDFLKNPDWRQIVNHYTAANLSRDEDILQALSGIASSLQDLGKGRYLGGLWEGDFVDHLLWRSSTDCRRPHSYTAPSFSWASRIGESDYIFLPAATVQDSSSYRVSLIDAQCHTNKANLFGAVSGGFVRLRGSLLPGSLSKDPKGHLLELRIDFSSAGPELVVHNCDGQRNIMLTLSATTTWSFDMDTHDDWDLAINGHIYIMPVVTELYRFELQTFDHAHCLVLVGNKDGTYNRVGLVDFRKLRDWRDLVAERDIMIV